MMKNTDLRKLKRCFWPLLCLFMIVYFFVLPISKYGISKYLSIEQQVNPLTRRLVDIFHEHRAKALSVEWYDRTEILNDKDIPHINWQEDTISTKGMNSFYCLDQKSDDIRPLLISDWDLPRDKEAWEIAKFTGIYLFRPDIAPRPDFQFMEKTDNTLRIKTGGKYDMWAYLVAKEKQPTTYALDFDFTPYTQNDETLQLCFAQSSLASRFRFLLEHNAILRFDIVDHGYFTFWKNEELWQKFRRPCHLTLREKHHIRLECINNVFALYFDYKLVFAVRVKDYVAEPKYWSLIMWNGIYKRENNNDNINIEVQIDNFKILHKKD